MVQPGEIMRTVLDFLKETVSEFIDDEAFRLAAALSFYAALSLAPITVVTLWVADLLWSSDSARQELLEWVRLGFGSSGAAQVETVVDHAGEARSDSIAALAALIALLFSATTAFHNLQVSMNKVWNIEEAPGRMVRGFVRKRVVSLIMLLALGLLLVGSVLASSVLDAVFQRLPGGVPWKLINIVGTIGLFTVMFAVVFHVLPDAQVAWRDVWLGSAVTALLFVLGKELAALYIARAGLGSAYGAAGSLIVLLFWIYYSSVVLFLGAEFTQVAARRFGRSIQPGKRAVSMQV